MPEAFGLSQKLRVTNEVTQLCSLNKYNEEVRLNSGASQRDVLSSTLDQSYTTQGFSNFQKARDSG